MKKILTIAAVLGLLVTTGCHPTLPLQPNGVPDLGNFQKGRGALVVRLVVESDSGYTVAATPKVLGDILSSVTFTIDGPHVPAPVTKTLTRADWTNANGSYKTINAAFLDVLPGEVTITVTGTGTNNGHKILGGSTTVTVTSDSITAATVVATFDKGKVEIGLDPNSGVPGVK